MPFAEHDDMVDPFPTDRADEPFDIGVLPGRARRCRSISDAERPKAPRNDRAISAVSIADEVLRGLLPAACLGEWPRNAFAANLVGQPDEDWRSYGRTQFDQRYSPLTQITPSNVRKSAILLGRSAPAICRAKTTRSRRLSKSRRSRCETLSISARSISACSRSMQRLGSCAGHTIRRCRTTRPSST